MDPFSFLGTIGGSLISGLFGNKSQKDAINAQKEMQREANKFAQGERIATQAWNAGMWQNELQAAKLASATDYRRAQVERELAYQRSRGAENRQAVRDASRVQTLVKDAAKAGIHPLAALGATGLSSGFAQAVPQGGGSQTAVPGAAPSVAAAPITASVPNAGNPMGDAIMSGIGMLLQLRQQQQDLMLRREEIGLMRSERVKRNLETMATLATARSRSVASSARSAAIGGPSISSGSASALDRLPPQTPAVIDFPNIGEVLVPLGLKGGQLIEDAMGEPGEWLLALDTAIGNIERQLFGGGTKIRPGSLVDRMKRFDWNAPLFPAPKVRSGTSPRGRIPGGV